MSGTNEIIETPIAFVVREFPQLSQTFIHREFESLWRRGQRFLVIATHRTPLDDSYFSKELQEIRRRTLFLDFRNPASYLRVLPQLAQAKTGPTLKWMLSLPHRTLRHRLRSLAAVAVAAHLAPELVARGVRYLHAQFAGIQTEIAMALSRILDIPYGGSWHAYDIYRDRNLLREKIAGAKMVASCTRHNVEHLRTLAPEHAERIVLAYHGVEVSAFAKARTSAPSEHRTVLAIGRLVPKKGFAHLIRAVGRVVRAGLKPHLVVIGDGPLRTELEALARSEQVDAEFRGSQPQAAVVAALASARVLVVPSVEDEHGDIDGLPNVVLEGMAARRPVIGSRLSGLPEAITDGKNGYLVTPGDEAQLAERISELILQGEVADALGREGFRVLCDGFSADANADFLWEHIRIAAQLKREDDVRYRRNHSA